MSISRSKAKSQESTSSSVSELPAAPPSSILQAAIDRQEKELADLQTELDRLADDFATRAAAMVRQGLQNSYSQARQRIGAIDLSFFDSGELSPAIDIPSLPSIEEVTA